MMALGVFLALSVLSGPVFAADGSPPGTIDPTAIPKYVVPLFIPPAMPQTGVLPGPVDYYEVAVRQFEQQVLPPGFPKTKVWGYGVPSIPGSFHSPSATFETTANRPVRVKWINDLKTQSTGLFLPHLLDVPQHLLWANPGMDCADGVARTDCMGMSQENYTGPVPIVVHLHGTHAGPESDGFPESWYLPDANNIPSGYATIGSDFEQFDPTNTDPGSAVFQYPNDQRATSLWYHDHTLGITRLNTYAGLAGFYMIRGGSSDTAAGILPGPAPRQGDPAGTNYYEIPLAIQDRTFNTDGSLYYSTPSPHEPFWGNAIMVNGNTWPYLNVEPRRYRLRLLNGCNARYLKLKMLRGTPIGDANKMSFYVLGSDGGFVPSPSRLQQITLSPAERADLLFDFTGVAPGTAFYLVNSGDLAENRPAGQIIKIIVGNLTSSDTSKPVGQFTLPSRTLLGSPNNTRRVSVNPEAFLGVVDTVTGEALSLKFPDPVTEVPTLNSTEVWEIENFSNDPHPIHIHLVQFEVLSRQNKRTGTVSGPQPWERGTKDTVDVRVNEIVRVKAKFDIPGLFVWHCHILEHEDDEMMRPYVVAPLASAAQASQARTSVR
jgi:bilirubin oxidase